MNKKYRIESETSLKDMDTPCVLMVNPKTSDWMVVNAQQYGHQVGVGVGGLVLAESRCDAENEARPAHLHGDWHTAVSMRVAQIEMNRPMDNDEDPLDPLDPLAADDDANEEQLIPEEMDEDQREMFTDDDDEEYSEDEEEDLPNLRTLGARFRRIGLQAVFDDLEPLYDPEPAAPIILYLLYPDLRRDVVQELRPWMVSFGCFKMFEVARAFEALGGLDLDEIEQEHSEALLEFVDELGSFMVEVQPTWQEGSLLPVHSLRDITYPLHAPLGPIVASKLLQYAQSVEPITRLALSCTHQHRVFRADEVEQLVRSILDLKQLRVLDVHIDLMGVLLLELCARLKDHDNLLRISIRGVHENAQQDLPNECHLIRSIQQISSLETLHFSFAVLGESTVNLFSNSEAPYTRLELCRCLFLIGDDDDDNDPRELPLAVALASNTRLVDLALRFVQGTRKFFEGIEHGLLKNRTLRKLDVSNYDGRPNQLIPEFAYFGWMQSIRLHPSLRQLVLDMDTWSSRVADAVCSVVRDNTSLRSIELSRGGHLEERADEFNSEWIGDIFQALQTNQTMVDVRIWVRSDFGARNWDRLAELLNVNDTIESVHLEEGDISVPDRVIELLQRVKSNRTLQRLCLKNARFRQNHTGALVDVLANNYVLGSLTYSQFKLDDEVQGREQHPIFCLDEGSKSLLKGILDLNNYGRKYVISEPNSVVHGVSLLSHVSSNLDAVYFHLRENPRLCDRREWKSLVAVRHLNAIPCGSDRCDRKRPRHAIERQADL